MRDNTQRQSHTENLPAHRLLIPFEEASQSSAQTDTTTPFSSKANPGSVTVSVIEGIEQSNMPTLIDRDARVKRPSKPPRRYREQARRLVDTRELQVMHQLAVTGQQAADVAVLLGGHELQIHRIERDEAMIEQLIALEAKFWAFVENDTPPPADGSDSAGQALRSLFPTDDGEAIDLTEKGRPIHVDLTAPNERRLDTSSAG